MCRVLRFVIYIIVEIILLTLFLALDGWHAAPDLARDFIGWLQDLWIEAK